MAQLSLHMALHRQNFWLHLAGQIGPPTFAGTMVACLLSNRFELMHGILLVVGVALIGLAHWHRRRVEDT